MSASHRIRSYLAHFFRAKRKGHGVHSPFVYELARDVFWDQLPNDPHPAEDWRKICLADTSTIDVKDFGTGTSGPRRICDIARSAAKPMKQGRLLERLLMHFRPAHMLELGTSLGITTLYQAAVDAHEKFISIEGCPETARIAAQQLREAKMEAEVVTGNFDEVLPDILKNFPRLDYVFFDGNHRLAPTLRYFELCLPLAHENSIFIFDDIHWSLEMEEAWKRICAHERVTVSIDLFDLGLVFFRKEQVKEHFVLKY